MPQLITGIIALNMSEKCYKLPPAGWIQSHVENQAGSLCQLSETINLEDSVFVIHKKLSALIIQAFVCFLINCIYLGIQRLI